MAVPFAFKTSVQAVQLTGMRATTLGELCEGLRQVDGSSVYHHTYRHLRTLHFLPKGYRSDFAQWVGENLREDSYAERMEALDLRDFSNIRELREALLAILEPAWKTPGTWNRRAPAGLEFDFCRSTSIVLPAGPRAVSVDEFVSGLHEVDTGSLFYHLVEAPLHAEGELRYRNDFSLWLESEFGLSEVARAVAELNPYRYDLEKLRKLMIEILSPNRFRRALQRVVARYVPADGSSPVRNWLKRWSQSGNGKE